MRRLVLILTVALYAAVKGYAQNFFNLTADEVKIDSLLPCFAWSCPLPDNYGDSIYTVGIDYPEFIDMTDADIRRYRIITSDSLPAMPRIETAVAVDRRKASLSVSFLPLVYRNGKYQKLVSFKLTVTARPRPALHRALAKDAANTSSPASRYAANSVLREGEWTKIRVPSSGIYQLTDALVKKAGFSDPSKVKIYGYGGNLQPERINGDYLASTDDLHEVPTCVVGGKRLFYANGPVSWDSSNNRVRNPYSDYGYYFLTSSDSAFATVDSTAFLNDHYPAAEDYNSLYEVDNYAWYTGGRNLYDAKLYVIGQPNKYKLSSAGTSNTGTLRVVLTSAKTEDGVVSISLNDSVVGTMTVAKSKSSYDNASMASKTFRVNNLQADNVVTITQTSGTDMRLDYITLHSDAPKARPQLASAAYPVPEYVYRITNQNHHADTPVDMVILISTNQQVREQAERLKTLHEQHDGMRVRIVPADELFNEFSSGTPDATAYRRYLKMLYDRAETEKDRPRYLLLFGDGAWDNRMLSSAWRNSCSPDDFLLCYESENSFSEVNCFVSDDYFCLMDDEEVLGVEKFDTDYNYTFTGQPDVAVGRLPARTAKEAKIYVDKIEAYMTNAQAGSWQNSVVMMGDDGNENAHMKAANDVATFIEKEAPAVDITRVMWDAYTRSTSSTGFSYPGARKACLEAMSNGALCLNYNGHGKPDQISHERVLTLADFKDNVSKSLPLWVTASCDIMPFDGQDENIGEEAMLNERGGAIAFLGTTRTVYITYNRLINMAFTKRLFEMDGNGKRQTIGEAVRKAKVMLVKGDTLLSDKPQTDLSINKLQYTLLGDPALALNYPIESVAIDSINGVALAGNRGTSLQLKAGEKVSVKGRVLQGETLNDHFNGVFTALVTGPEKTITCKLNSNTAKNEKDGSSTAFVYKDRQEHLFKGTDSISGGRFTFTFVVPKDITYSDASGRLTVYAVSNDKQQVVNGVSEKFCLNGSSTFKQDSIGPSIYCYLNSSSFVNGGQVNSSPYFVAEVSDEDGINVSGNGIGHDMVLTIDDDPTQAYTLNDAFVLDFGSYTSGSVGYQLPTLAEGKHKLRFQAWDILNNATVAELAFQVVKGLEPSLYDVECTKNPAKTSTSFRILHDRIGGELDVVIDIFDMSGRHLWSFGTTETPTSGVLNVDWDLTVDNGQRLGTGVYLYRTRVSCEGSNYVSKTKKLVILNNK